MERRRAAAPFLVLVAARRFAVGLQSVRHESERVGHIRTDREGGDDDPGRNSSNQKQQEVSQFNYAKLSYELGFQDVALTELQEFLSKYPQSEYNNEAKELLVNMLASTNNYKDALVLMSTISFVGIAHLWSWYMIWMVGFAAVLPRCVR